MKKLDLKVGFACNNYCKHCVQSYKRNVVDKSTERLKKEIIDGYKDGCRAIVFTGGEPTIRKDIIELIRFAKDVGYERIQVQSNGRMLKYKKFVDALVEAGMNEFSPAVNGHIPEVHDFLASVNGAWEQTVQAIKNVREYGDVVILTNTVVTKPNYRWLKEIAELLVDLGVDQYQLAFVHSAGNAWYNFDFIVPYMELAAPKIKEGLQVGIDVGIRVMAEAMPFCLMENYESYVAELYMPPTEIKDAWWTVEDFKKSKIEEGGKFKPAKCRECRFYPICEGIWSDYAAKRGTKELHPVPGEYIYDAEEVLNWANEYW